MDEFLKGMDPRALVYMFSEVQGRRFDSLKNKNVDEMREAFKLQSEIDTDDWARRTNDFLNGDANNVNWNQFKVFGTARPMTVPGTPTRGGGRSGTEVEVQGVPATPGGFDSNVAQQMLTALTNLNDKLDKLNLTQLNSNGQNKHGRDQHKSVGRINELLNEFHDAEDVEDGDDEPPAKKAKETKTTVMEAIRGYFDASTPLTDRQRVLRLERLNVDYKTLNGLFSALRSIGATVDTSQIGFRCFMESLGHTEKMVQELFTEAVSQQKFITAEYQDRLKQKYMALIKVKLLSTKDFNFVKSAADAQQQIMKDMKDMRPPRRDDRPPRARDERPKCFECGRLGHKSFDCKASQEDRDKHKAARAAARSGQ